MKQAIYFVAISGFLAITGCESGEKTPAPAPVEPVTAPVPVAVIEPVGAAAVEEPVKAPVVQKEEPTATVPGTSIVRIQPGSVNITDFPMKGELQDNFFAWEDKLGTNALIFTLEKRGKTGTLLTATHGRMQNDGSWKVIRDFKELIDACELDTILKPYSGDWSVTDIDKDGIGEATFAWKAACISDHSPLTFKVLMTEDGDKYILRGTTHVEGMGGKFKADPEFSKAPKGFQAHAEKVWAESIKLP